MSAFTSPDLTCAWRESRALSDLMRGEILIATRSYTAWGGAVTARLLLPIARDRVWAQLTDYARWVQYLPALSHSEVISQTGNHTKRLYQVASKHFLLFTAQVDIYLNVTETPQERIQFALERGSFHDFTADLQLADCDAGTLLSYAVQATPTIPVPALFIQQAMQLDLPSNLRHLRQVLCQTSGTPVAGTC